HRRDVRVLPAAEGVEVSLVALVLGAVDEAADVHVLLVEAEVAEGRRRAAVLVGFVRVPPRRATGEVREVRERVTGRLEITVHVRAPRPRPTVLVRGPERRLEEPLADAGDDADAEATAAAEL